MKKIFNISIAFVLSISILPTYSLAQGYSGIQDDEALNWSSGISEDNSSSYVSDVQEKEEYNELGIKNGTEVYGEDISKLSEEELQYVPEAWRSGNFESEHRGDTNQRTFSIMKARYPKEHSLTRMPY